MNLKQKLFLALLIAFWVVNLNAQKFSKAKINLIGRDILDLTKAGLETDHGLFVKNRFFISDFSEAELELVKGLGFDTEILIDDVESYYADALRPSYYKDVAYKSGSCFGTPTAEYPYKTPYQYRDGSMGGYFTYEDMLAILDTMAMKYPQLISPPTPIDTFKTYEGKPIMYVKLTQNVASDDPQKPQILYTALHHAREPNSLSQMIFYLWYLLENYEMDPLVRKIVDETTLYFIPCVNPDGYIQNQISHPNGGGLWRKNKWVNAAGELKGVDLNRNYGHFWGTDNIGSSDNPNSQTYRGVGPFSEPETQAIRSFCLKHDIKMAQNYHTFGNYLIHPWGYNDQPTADDKIFKTIGNVLNKENHFKMGTGIETVGYTVNGDSDDWMYGAIDEKNAIFSYTPEVGYTFWPAKVDIDYLNKSCLWMNLATALVTLNYYYAEEVLGTPYISNTENKILIQVSRAGLKDGNSIVKLLSNTQGIRIKDEERSVFLNVGENEVLSYEIEINDLLNIEEVNFSLLVLNDGLETITPITKTWLKQPFQLIYEDKIELMSNFVNNGWQMTDQTFLSPPFSLTDSPDGLYNNNYSATITTAQPVNLSGASHASLEFYAKWNIEDNYDFVQVLASHDNADYIPLCGKYTDTGTADQQFGSPLYDGTQLDWVLEQIDLKEFIGKSQVWFRFLIKTDQYEQADGFYFDDLKVKAIFPVTNFIEDKTVNFRLYPSIANSDENIFVKLPTGFILTPMVTLTNIMGHCVGQVPIIQGIFTLKDLNLPSGVYFCQFQTDEGVNKTAKLVIK